MYRVKKEIGPNVKEDKDGIMLWNGKRCEKIPCSKIEQKEMEKLINKFKYEKNK